MGMEYVHLLAVRDLDWRATKAHGEAIHTVLRDWGLITARPSLISYGDPPGSHGRELAGASIRASGVLPPELHMAYDTGTADSEALERVLGKAHSSSRGLCAPAPWFINVELGVTYKACGALGVGFAFLDWESSEEVWDAELDQAGPREHLNWDPARPLPRVSVRCVDYTGQPAPKPRGLNPVYRSGLSFDCGKLFPTFVQDGPLQLPNRDFVRDLTRAFGTPLVEIGLVE